MVKVILIVMAIDNHDSERRCEFEKEFEPLVESVMLTSIVMNINIENQHQGQNESQCAPNARDVFTTDK